MTSDNSKYAKVMAVWVVTLAALFMFQSYFTR